MRDVTVVGGGPVGSRVAERLASLGHDVAVLERAPAPGHKTCCTGIISQECAGTFGIGADVTICMASSALFFPPSGNGLRLSRPGAQACILDRCAFDRHMAQLAQDNGATYLPGNMVTSIEIEADRAVCRCGQRRVESRAVVISSGFGPGLTRSLGLGTVPDYAAGAQADVELKGANEVEVYFGHDIAPGFFAWLVPALPGKARVGLLARRNPGAYLRKFMAALVTQGKIASAEEEISYGGVPLQSLPRTFADRLLVVGDAAGQVKPTSGGGIYYGLLCADIAAANLHQALAANDLSARYLAGYEKAWQKRLGHELRVDSWARKLFERLSDEQLDRAFRIAREKRLDSTLMDAKDVSFDWHSQAIARLLGYRALTGALGVMKLPFKLGRN